MDIRTIKAIDMHCHFNHGSPFEHTTSPIYHPTLDFILNQDYVACNIEKGVFSTMASVLSDKPVFEENIHMAAVRDAEPRVFQWAVLDPRQEKLLEQVDELLKHDKVLGIKIHPAYHEYDLGVYGDPIFALATKHKKFILTHNGDHDAELKYANKYPEANLIIAHMGSDETGIIDTVKAAKHGNIFTDTSGIASSMNNVVEYAVSQIGSEKIFFGTDTYACSFQRGRIEYARISDTDKMNILRNNALRNFPILG